MVAKLSHLARAFVRVIRVELAPLRDRGGAELWDLIVVDQLRECFATCAIAWWRNWMRGERLTFLRKVLCSIVAVLCLRSGAIGAERQSYRRAERSHRAATSGEAAEVA